MAFERELLIATEAVRKASFLTKKIQSNLLNNGPDDSFIKQDNSPVTIGDFGAQALIINAIKSNFPTDNIVAEENSDDLTDDFVEQILKEIRCNDVQYENQIASKGTAKSIDFTNDDFPLRTVKDVKDTIDLGNYSGGQKGRFWCLDPIDGTKGFLRGAQYAVCLALVIDGVVQLGVIGCPNLKLKDYGGVDLPNCAELGYLFRATAGQGAYYSVAIQNEWNAITVRDLKDTSEIVALEGYEKSHSSHDEQSIIKEKLQITRSIHLDSQVKYCLLAAGVGDLYLRLPYNLEYQEKIWDHAAGNIIVLEAGGMHSDACFGVPLDFSKGRYLTTKGVIASCGPANLHETVLFVSSALVHSKFT
ncbi:3'(2'),5'-bisphosphate nucleotidase Ecym_3552 [Eremothecium cymbalariae DBVPG|uniref:3'(2'),5'-bisphosphate nucleotidase n=1 Tax=Eremothecium cymbalariae (strain CBS 270.75 / DBVPG 7215 / KCTC 17166 / NRRL Y-17582) TaxID=931890 RepID=G8JQP1_ERECY|nr:Hypothetical protein Ecym_3552 [Eremothecium cymbalariae DBVPG\